MGVHPVPVTKTSVIIFRLLPRAEMLPLVIIKPTYIFSFICEINATREKSTFTIRALKTCLHYGDKGESNDSLYFKICQTVMVTGHHHEICSHTQKYYIMCNYTQKTLPSFRLAQNILLLHTCIISQTAICRHNRITMK